MSSIDQRVVEIKLDNKQFEGGVSSTMSALDKLKAALRFDGAQKSMADLNNVGKGFNLDNIGRAVEDIKGKFTAMSVAGIAALATLANKAVNAGVGMAKNIFDPLTEGFAEYELKMGSIQTILANTARHGTELGTVTSELDKLNTYADKTIYSFSDMTKNASLFTNAGIKIEDATTMIKGFSNAAAASGVSSGAASGAAYQLTQAMNSGVVRLMDWRSLTNAGMGSKNMQEGLIQVAGAMGTFNSETTDATHAGKDFNGSLEKQWLTADVMSTYLKIMSGDMTDAEMAAQGLSDVEIKSLRRAADDAFEAATKVRTFSQLIGTMKEAVGSGWAKTIELVIGDFDQATELFTGISDTLGGMIGRSADARNKLIQEFVDLGGRDDIIQGFKNIFDSLMAIIGPIQKAFREVFPPKTGADLKTLSSGFLRFTEIIKMGAEGVGKMVPVIKLVLIPIKLLFNILGALTSVVVAFVGGAGMLVGMMAKLGFGFAQWLLQTETAHRIFTGLQNLWQSVIGTLRDFGDRLRLAGEMFQRAFIWLKDGKTEIAIAHLTKGLGLIGIEVGRAAKWARQFAEVFEHVRNALSNFKSGGYDQAFLALSAAFEALGVKTESAQRYARKLVDIFLKFDSIGGKIASVVETIAEAFASLRGKLDIGFGINTDKLDEIKGKTEGIQTAWEFFKKFMGGLGSFVGQVLGGLGEFIITAINKITDYLKTLTFGELLALINTGFFIAMYTMITKFASDMGGVAKSFSGALDTIGGAIEGFAKKESLATKILKIAIAIGILAASAYVLAGVDAGALAKALAAIAVMLAQLAITMKLMSKIEFGDDAKIIKAGIALAIMALAILVLSHAVQNFEGLSWEDMAKGLIGVSVLLGALALFTKIAELNGGGIKASVGLIILALAIRLLATSVEKFGEMDTKVLQKGLLTLGILLVGLMAMTKVMNGAQLTSAAIGLLILSGSLIALSFALRYYSTLDWAMLLDGLAKLAVVLIGVGIAARTLPSNLPITAIGLILVAGALALLVPVLAALGNLPIPVIVQGLATIAVALGVMAAAMWVLSAPGTLAGAAALVIVVGALYLLLPVLIALGSLPWEVVLLGLAALAGVFLVLGAAGMLLGPAVPVLIALAAVIVALGLAAIMVGAGMALFGIGFAAMAGAIVAGSAIILSFLQGIMMMLPLFAQQLALAIVAFAVVIRDSGPALVGAITTVLMSILMSIQRLSPVFAATIAILIMDMVNTVARLAPQLAQRGLEMMLRLMTIVGEYVPQIVDQALQLMHDFLSAVSDNIGPIVDEATRLMVEFMDGIERNIPELVESGERMVRTFIREVGAALLGGVGDMIDNGAELAGGIVSGMVAGVRNGITSVENAARDMASSALRAAKNFLGMSSPSKEFKEVGRYSDEGMALGMKAYTGVVVKASEGVGEAAIYAMKKSIGRIPAAISGDMNLNPTIKPVLDLSDVQRSARELDPLLNAKAISFDTSVKGAQAADTGYRSNRNAAEEISEKAREEVRKVEYNQYNNSPKALSPVEIYRQTKNQLTLMKEV